MIEKFVSIKNVGKFESFDAAGDISLRKISIVFSENGRGKTTLANILRSLSRNDSSFVEERKTLGATGAPYIEIKLDSGLAQYNSGNWNKTYPDLLIFDELFINQNVCSGLTVAHEHKKNLYRFIIGETGIQKAKRIVEIDGESRQKAGVISSIEDQIKKHLPEGMEVEPFIETKEDPAIEEKILLKQKEVTELQDADSIDTSSELSKLGLVDFDLENLINLLAKSLPDVSSDAEAKTKEHISKLLGEGGEDWLRKGVDFIKDDSCPFCAQSISGVEIIESFKDFFDESYNTLRNEISDSITEIKTSLSSSKIVTLQKLLLANQKLFDFWKKHIEFSLSTPDLSKVSDKLSTLRVAALTILRRKEASPLDKLDVPDQVTIALKEYKGASNAVDDYNAEIEKLNRLIKGKKEKTKAGDLTQAKTELDGLKLIKKRHEPEINKLCLSYNIAVKEKEVLALEKAQLKAELDELTGKILEKYQEIINRRLVSFGADFEIVETERGYAGGKPSTMYSLSINGQRVELGDDDTPVGTPCFKNTLSDGDRRTLAFAFFLAKLEQDTSLGNKTIVFDDPVSSLDLHRKTHAADAILNIARRSQQIVIMSHDPHFCFKFFKLARDTGIATKTIKIIREGPRDSKIVEWDPASDTRTEYFKDCDKLSEFINSGAIDDLTSIARRIRPVLEGNLGMRFPCTFPSNAWLGDMIKEIRDASDQDLLGEMKAKLPELEAINNFSKKFHHNKNDNADSETTTDTELKSFVKRTFEFIAGV